jgi:CRP-like cAMP-binding protein
MFVIISGQAEVRLNTKNQSRSLWVMQRGDVFGITGLMRSEERISEVIALDDVEVLAMDERFRTRVWRYPRIAARIFFNLSNTLLSLLQDTMQRESRTSHGRSSQIP